MRPDDDPNFGYRYTFVAIERHTKLVLNIAMGKRDHAETVEISLGNMDRLTLAAGGRPSPAPAGFCSRFLRMFRQTIGRFLRSTNI